MVRLFAKNVYEQLHNCKPTTKEGKIAKAFAHGVIGEWAARMAGNALGGYTLHVIGVEAGAYISVNRTVVKFVGYQNQL